MLPKTEGVVLKSFDFRETSRIATFFTKDYGKITGVLKGIRKDRKKFGSSADRFTVNDIVYYPTRHSDIHLISQCDMKAFFGLIRQDYRRSTAAHYALELVNTMMPTEYVNGKIYELLLNYLASLETVSDINKLVHIFQVKLLLHSGFRPHLDACVKCQRKAAGRARFSLKSGGLICPQCPTRETGFILISPGTIASVLYIEHHNWSQCLKLNLTKVVQKELKFILNNFLTYHLEKRIQSAKYL